MILVVRWVVSCNSLSGQRVAYLVEQKPASRNPRRNRYHSGLDRRRSHSAVACSEVGNARVERVVLATARN